MRRILRAALITIGLFFHHEFSNAVEPLRLSTPITEGAQLRLNWSGGSGPFQLQDAAAPNGPWLNVGAAISATSTTVAVTPPQRYFRVSGALTETNSGAAALNATIVAVQAFLDTVPTADRQAWRTQITNFLN